MEKKDRKEAKTLTTNGIENELKTAEQRTVRVSQMMTSISSEAVATYFESEDHATSDIPSLCPLSVLSHWPLAAFHIFTLLSEASTTPVRLGWRSSRVPYMPTPSGCRPEKNVHCRQNHGKRLSTAQTTRMLLTKKLHKQNPQKLGKKSPSNMVNHIVEMVAVDDLDTALSWPSN